MKRSILFGLMVVGLVGAAAASEGACAETMEVRSPEGALVVSFIVNSGEMQWSLSRKGQVLVRPSRLGLTFSGFKPGTGNV